MADIKVGSLNFPVIGKEVDVYKEEAENGNRPILCREIPENGGFLVHQFLVASTDDDPTILATAEAELNGIGLR